MGQITPFPDDLPPIPPWTELPDNTVSYNSVLEIVTFLMSWDFFWLFIIYLIYRLVRLWMQLRYNGEITFPDSWKK